MITVNESHHSAGIGWSISAVYPRGDPDATPQALFQIVDSENPPLRFNLGKHNLAWVQAAYAERLATWEAWQSVSESAQGEPK